MVGYGSQIQVLLKACDMAQKELGVSCEVIDLRTIIPWDVDTVAQVCEGFDWCLVLEGIIFSFSFVCNRMFTLLSVLLSHCSLCARLVVWSSLMKLNSLQAMLVKFRPQYRYYYSVYYFSESKSLIPRPIFVWSNDVKNMYFWHCSIKEMSGLYTSVLI